jgi:hypothetical protein
MHGASLLDMQQTRFQPCGVGMYMIISEQRNDSDITRRPLTLSVQQSLLCRVNTMYHLAAGYMCGNSLDYKREQVMIPPAQFVFIMISRQPYHGTHRKLVLAFDVGTTYSGISYSVLDPGEVPQIKGVTR